MAATSFDDFLDTCQSAATASFNGISLSHPCFLIHSPSRTLNFRYALYLAGRYRGLRIDPAHLPADFLLVRQEKINSISIDDARKIKEFILLKPIDSRGRVVLIDRADALSLEAQNALLKVLEEPPERTCFLLCCRNPDYLLPTIRSRIASLRPVLPGSAPVKRFLSGLFEEGMSDFVSCVLAADPAEVFELQPSECLKNALLKPLENQSGAKLVVPDLFQAGDFSDWISDVAAGRVGEAFMTVGGGLVVFARNLLNLAGRGDVTECLSMLHRNMSLIDDLLAGYHKKQGDCTKEDLEIFRRERICPLLLLTVSGFLSGSVQNFPGNSIPWFDNSRRVRALERIEDWFVSKNLKFTPVFENIVLRLVS
ncbi:MAG: hypothetical protein PHQ23_07620 [Candidatus Wallbacteria bacterium]|nr:hypothetical protein [Candidatus Wallbacteria bacterium]